MLRILTGIVNKRKQQANVTCYLKTMCQNPITTTNERRESWDGPYCSLLVHKGGSRRAAEGQLTRASSDRTMALN